MDPLIHCNGRIVDVAEAGVPPTSAGLLYGWGILTTLAIYGGSVFAFDRHWDRLVSHSEQARVPIPAGAEDLERALSELIAANSITDGRARVTVTRGSAGVWRRGASEDSSLFIFTSPQPPRSRHRVAITISPYRILSHGPLRGVKRTGMLENLLALEEARSRKFADAVIVNERGEVTGTSTANIFWVEASVVYTPSLATGCVAGITRGLVIEIAHRAGLHLVEGSFPVQRLLGAGEVFLTSTMLEIAQVSSFDVKEYDCRQAPFTLLIDRQFQKMKRSAKIGSRRPGS